MAYYFLILTTIRVKKMQSLKSKNIITLITLAVFLTSLSGCATTYHRDDGIIIAEKKIGNKDYKPHQATENGVRVGASVGGTSGAVMGGLFGLCAGAFSESIPIMVFTTAVGGVVGAAIYGAAGGLIGGGIGYAVDATAPDAGTYEFTVKPDQGSKPVTVTQYGRPLPINTPVHILEKDHRVFIEK